MNRRKVTRAEMVILAAGAVMLLGSFLDFSLGRSAWSHGWFPIVTLIPISINGFGLQELSVTYLFLHVGGMSAAASLGLAVLIRIIWMLASLPGAVFLPSILLAISYQKKDPSTAELHLPHD